nr:hypothetical protein XAC3615_11390005 [Xanthomonas citri pv. citri]
MKPLHGCARRRGDHVAPSRARGLKRATDSDARGPADRRALTGAWIETSLTPRVRDPACVAPSRARGLKRRLPRPACWRGACRALTGAWIETG